MKKLAFSFLLFFAAFSGVYAQWSDVTPTQAPNHFAASVIDDLHAAILSDDSLNMVMSTADGGQTWKSLGKPVWIEGDPMYLYGIQFTDPQHGFLYGTWLVAGGVYAGGTETFVIYATNDGGLTWELRPPQVPNVGFETISSIHFFNPQKGYTTLTTGLGYDLLKTTDDGGVSWQTRDTILYWESSQSLRNDGSGVALRYQYNFNTQTTFYKVYTVADFGKKWAFIGDPAQDPNWAEHRKGLWYEGVYMHNDADAFRLRSVQQGPNLYDLHLDRSSDGGNTWTEDYFTLENSSLNGFFVKEKSVWVATHKKLFRTDFSVGTGKGPELLSAMKLFPNPVAGGANVEVLLEENLDGAASALIFASDGRLLSTQQLRFIQGKATLSAAGIPAGVQRVQIRSGERMFLANLLVR